MRSLLVACIALTSMIACGPGARQPGTGDDASTSDAPPAQCNAGEHMCAGATYESCSGGQWQVDMDCPVACDMTLGCVACAPNSMTCSGGDVHTCDGTGAVGPVAMACTGATVCENGAGGVACADAATSRSYLGCEYYAVDLDNALEVIDAQGSLNCTATPGVKNVTMKACKDSSGTIAGQCDPPNDACPSGFTCASTAVCILDAQHAPFAVVVSNPQARAVDVTLTGANGTAMTVSVAAGAVSPIEPNIAPATIPDQSVDGTGKVKAAYKITSTLPIVAYQFNPLDNVDVFSNDASLLIPRTAFDTEYYVMSWPTLDRRNPAPGAQDFAGYLTVVAWQDATVIEVTTTAAVQASASQATIAAGTTTEFTLNAMEVLNLEAQGPAGDLTGTRIVSKDGMQTFGVFGGHEAADFGEATPPDSTHTLGPCCADHMEDMLFPTSTWGKTFAIARSAQRSGEHDVIRVMAQKAGTTVAITPAPSSGTCGTLAAGGFCEVRIAVDTAITTSDPVLVGHFLESAIWQDPLFGDAVGNGDPSMSIAVPTEQFRSDYILPVPNAYDKNFLSISAPSTGTVLVDGQPVTMSSFAGGMYRAGRIIVQPGQHHLTCPNTCGVEVYGYSDAVSYMFAGGLDLKQIVIN